MHLLTALNVLLAGVWAGMYLFTTLVVSPAFVQLFPDAAERAAYRRVVGRIYARVNGFVTALLVLAVLALGVRHGWTWALRAELLLLAVIGALTGWHVWQSGGERTQDRPPTPWLTQLTLLAVLLLCVAALLA
ncbi:DUF4149 domain-containing protein [Deinococcus sp. Marseille-Q6407]|uniref:DUF4149 domain-containing protein n=1 Tax=Deinococcus sp. Marseille-Q6407 TaxID=2969223 RepID=UPI0021BF7E59|nr:DUF4149 domain-containing protein [Deinococcus sp. Marseille-Q6407]